jgi:hypothetical protein
MLVCHLSFKLFMQLVDSQSNYSLIAKGIAPYNGWRLIALPGTRLHGRITSKVLHSHVHSQKKTQALHYD